MVLPCLAAAFNSICGTCFGWVGERLSAEAAHLVSYGDNIENLRKHVQDLSDAIESVKDRIEEAESSRGATRVDAVVDRLLERMTSLREEASKIITDEERESDCTCIVRLRLNLWACYLTSKSARKAIDEATELLEKEKKHDRPVANVDYSNSLGVTPILDFEELESRVLVSTQIEAALKDPSVNTVGVYGMGGAGKTTLAEKIGAVLQLDGTFNYVVLATVSEKQNQLENNYLPDLSNIQKQIAGGLKIQLQGENLRDRAAELREQLQKKDRVLIILDDIWSRFELKDVGVPIGNDHRKFKILMTSRSEMVLRKEMDSTRNYGLDSLPLSDASILFDRMVGGDDQYYNWRPTAEQVVIQCGGIPILLVTIARALRNEDSKTWEDAVTQLKQFDGEDIVKEAYKRIEVSYKFLKNEEIKKLLLLCAQLNHRSIPMDGLLKYAMGLSLFKGCKKIKEVSDRLHKYLRDLKGCCLLQDGNEQGIIKMHDVVHKFASLVAFRDHHVFSVADGELQDWPSKDEFENFSAISLPFCHLPPDRMLPAAFDNPKLESFLMLRSEVDASFKIPDNFFAGMRGLKLMDLTMMSLSTLLVSSLSALVKLRTLCLDGCEISDIRVIGELPLLQALSLVGSSIVLVPKEIGRLGSTLKLLDLRDCRQLESIASGVISKLTLLEDLRIGKSFTSWDRLEGSDKSSNSVDMVYEAEVASLSEFNNLQNLINIEICIPDHANMYPKDLVFKKLETFRIFIGRELWSDDYLLPKGLVVNEYSKVVEFNNEGTKTLMTRAESLLLESVVSSVSISEMDLKGFPELKNLKVTKGHGIRYIVRKNYKNCIFPKLETMDLLFLKELERICDPMPPVGSFENLRVIYVYVCPLLNDLLSSNLARSLLCLKEIKVVSCSSMKSIIVSRESQIEEEIKILIHLRVLHLHDLPGLLSFYNFKQLEGLPSPTHLFNKKILFSELEELKLDDMKIEKIWDVDHLATAAEATCWFQNLTSLKVYRCDNLSYVFTFSMVKSFAQLKKFEVSYCESIEEIVSIMEGEIQGEKLLFFPKLESVKLYSLPTLKRFCHANSLECPSLQTLEISQCPHLKAFISANDSTPGVGANSTPLFDRKIVFPKLEILYLCYLKIEKIWDHFAIAAGEETTCWFQNLTSFDVSKCYNLRYLFTFSMVKSLAKLKNLQVSDCGHIEEIVALMEGATTEDIQLSFPKLEKIKLDDLSNLKRFCEANLLKCQLLQKLNLYKCCKMKTFVSANDSSSSDNSTTLFTEKVAIPNLEELKICRSDSLKKVFDVQRLPMNEREACRILPFQNLRSVDVSYCESLTSIFPTSLIPTCLQPELCEKVLDVQRLPMDERETWRNLRSVDLSNCPSLTTMFPASLVPALQQVERLRVENCHKIDLFAFNNTQQLNDALAKLISSLKYCYLDIGGMKFTINEYTSGTLKIDGCGFQVPPILFALLKSFLKLEKVDVSSSSIIQLFPCEPDHLVVADVNDMDTQANTLGRIGNLKLTNLSNMKQIWSEHSPLKYHGIPEILEVKNCDSLLTLAPPSTTLLKNLTGLIVHACNNLSYLFTSSMVKSLAKLKTLEVRDCESIEEIVASTERATAGDIHLSFPKLDYIYLVNLPNLKRFCQANLIEYQVLQKFLIENCSKLRTFVSANDSSDNSTTLFTEKVAFPNLEELTLSGCDALEKVFDVERFPMNERETCRILQSMVVSDCQSLTSIFSTSLVQTRQQLERLEVRNCDKFDLFRFTNPQQLHDAFAKVSSSLKYCYLESSGLKLKYQHQSFKLKIDGCGFEVPPMFFALLQSVNLDKVVVSNYSIIHLFPCETDHLAAADIDIQAKTLMCIPHLKLTQLSNMKQIWSEHSPLKYHVIPEVLEVYDCDILFSLAPPSTTLFKNLTCLIVEDCPELMKLVASSSTAKSLVNLKKMSVRNCGSLEEIVVIDDQWDEEVASNDEYIVFEKMEVLDLQELDSLTSFCSASDCNFRFPSLNRVIVYDCPKMKFFSEGDLSTPKLIAVEVGYVLDSEDEEERTTNKTKWEGDLNSTIRQMFKGSDGDTSDDEDDENEDSDGDD